MPCMVLNTIICLVHKINLKLIVTYRMTVQKLVMYTTVMEYHITIAKFKVGILRYFEIRFAPFLLTRGQKKWITQRNASDLRLRSTRSFLIKAQAETKAKKK